MSKIIFTDDTWWDKFLDFIDWYRIQDIFKNWIYPAYDLKNLLIHRHDTIKIPQIKPWEYTDISYFMLCANMEMIVKFIEVEQPEKHVLWYKDEKGNDIGHKYGEFEQYNKWLYPQLKDKWIMDIIKEIYHWWKIDYQMLLKERDYLLGFWCDRLVGDIVFESVQDENNKNLDLCEIKHDKTNTIKTIEQLDQTRDLNWDILNKYISDKKLIIDEDYVNSVIKQLDQRIHNEEQYYLHLCIEVRPYLWT